MNQTTNKNLRYNVVNDYSVRTVSSSIEALLLKTHTDKHTNTHTHRHTHTHIHTNLVEEKEGNLNLNIRKFYSLYEIVARMGSNTFSQSDVYLIYRVSVHCSVCPLKLKFE